MKGKKGVIHIALIIAGIFALVFALGSIVTYFQESGNGFKNLFVDDVESGTDVAPNCKPVKYIVKLEGSLDVINQKQGTWTLDYEVDYLDAHIYDILWDRAPGSFGYDEIVGTVCIYDVLAGGDNWGHEQIDCVGIKKNVALGQIEKIPFTFKYDLYDNDCNGEVDDHTFNLVVDYKTEDGTHVEEQKTVAIVKGQSIYQNAKGY